MIPSGGGGTVCSVVVFLSAAVVSFDACFVCVSETGVGTRVGGIADGVSLGYLRQGVVSVLEGTGGLGGWQI